MSSKTFFDGDAFIRRLSSVNKAVAEKTPEALLELANEIAGEAKLRTPVNSGELRDSIHVKAAPGGRVVDIIVGPVFNRNGYNYAIAMHEGHPAVPGGKYKLGPTSALLNGGTPHYGKGIGIKFLERAFDFVVRNARKRIAEGVKEAISSAVRGV